MSLLLEYALLYVCTNIFNYQAAIGPEVVSVLLCLHAMPASLPYCRWMTRIVLPLKKDHQTTKKFRDIQPSLLLFLHRLRSITVEDQVDSELVDLTPVARSCS